MRGRNVFLLVAIFCLPSIAIAEDTRHGAGLYQFCSGCHGVQGQGDVTRSAPRLAGLPGWYLKRQIENFMKGMRRGAEIDIAAHNMFKASSVFQSDDDVDAVVAYAAALSAQSPRPTVPGNARRGEKYYQYCSGCHGAKALGGRRLGTPPLAGQHDWYLVKQIMAFRSGLRGNHPEQTQSGEMAPMTLLLPDVQAIDDVVSYINSLSP